VFVLQFLVIISIIGALASLALTVMPLVPGRATGDLAENRSGEPGPGEKKAAAEVGCPKCGAKQPAGNRFCGKCGSPLGEAK